MHIVALASYLSSKRGGLEHSLLDVCQALANRGHQITLVYEEGGDQLEKYQQFCTELIKITSYKFNVRFLSDICRVASTQSSVIYSNQYNNFFFGRILSRLQGIPLVCHLRLHASTESSFLKRIKQSLTLSGISRYIAISEAVKADWSDRLSIPSDRIDVVYNGVNPASFKSVDSSATLREDWNIPEHVKVVSYVGRLERVKGIEILIKSFALLQQTGTNAHLLIAGKSLFSGEEYRESLEQLAQELGVADYVHFLGHISNTKALYHASDVVVLPSIWLEAFGRVVIEAMASGTPMIGSRVGGIPEILTGEFEDWLFEPNHEQDLLRALQQLIHWRDKTPDLGERCREHVVNNFSLEKTIEGVEQILLKSTAP